MLRITVHHGQGSTRFGVEGSLTEPSAEELKKCWQDVCAFGPHTECLSVDLTAMTNIDSVGKGILFDMYRSGVELVGSGVMIRAVINEIGCIE
jgi:anti-anti-sigma regulatory factor